MGIILRLEQGGDVLDLQTGRYCIDDNGFMPPTTAREVTFGRASVGQDLAGKRRANRAWQFEVNIEAASVSEVERAIRDLQSFLNRAGMSRSEPLYIAFRGWDGHTLEPYFGQFSAFARYEVVSAQAEVVSEYINPASQSYRAPHVLVDVVIKPQALGLPQRVGLAEGSVYEDVTGKRDGDTRGTVVLGYGQKNQFSNEYFNSASGYDTGWSTGGTGTIKSENRNPDFITFGVRSLKFSSIQTDNSATLYQSYATTDTNTYTFGCLVKREDGGAVTSSELGFLFSGTGGSSHYTSVGNGWYWCGRTFTADTTGATNNGFYWNSPVPVYFSATTLLTTSNAAHPQTDTNNYSLSSSVGTITFDFGDVMPNRNNWTMRAVWSPPPFSSGTRHILDDTNGSIQLYIDGSNQVVAQSSTGNSVTSTAISLTAGTPIALHVTYNGDALTIYKNGAQLATGSSKAAATAAATSMDVCSNGSGNQLYGSLMGLATFAEPMTAAEVLADYTQVAQLITDDQRIDPLPYINSLTGTTIDNDYAATGTKPYAFIAGIMGDDAEAEFYVKNSAAYNSSHGLVLGVAPTSPRIFSRNDYDTDLFLKPGTGTVDANAMNGACEQQSLNTTVLEFVDSSETGLFYAVTRGQEVWAWAVCKDAGSNLQLRLVVNLGSEKLYSDWRSVTASGAYYGFLLGPVTIPDNPAIIDAEQKLGFAVEAKRTVAGAANLSVSHAMYMLNATYADASKLQTPAGADAVYIRGREVVAVLSSGSTTLGLGRVPLMPRPLKIEPNKINGLLVQMGADSKTWTATYTADFDKISIRPRWDIY